MQLHTQLQTFPVHPEGHDLMATTETQHLQKAQGQFWGPQSGNSPPQLHLKIVGKGPTTETRDLRHNSELWTLDDYG